MNSEEFCYPLDGNDMNVYSWRQGFAPFSFWHGSSIVRECPAPTYLTPSSVIIQKSYVILNEKYDMHEKGGLIWNDVETIKKQRKVLGEIFKQLGKFLMRGKSVIELSLPITIFEPRATIERIFDRWGFMQAYLPLAMSHSDPLERFKLVLALGIAGLHLCAGQGKPFHPIQGETWEVEWPDLTRGYAEHISHDPPITAFQIFGAGFTISGHSILSGKFKPNKFLGGQLGPAIIEFFDGQKIKIQCEALLHVNGVAMGQRKVNYFGDVVFQDTTYGYNARVTIGAKRPAKLFQKQIGQKDDLTGKIWLGQEHIADVEGSWLNYLHINDVEYWNINRTQPVFHSPVLWPAPSDWRYREDLIWLIRDNLKFAQNWKYRLEGQERKDRILRN